jgi:hypothetical protein
MTEPRVEDMAKAQDIVRSLRITSTRYADDRGSARHVPECPCCAATMIIAQALADARAEGIAQERAATPR